jgi:hypothetical protein
LSIKFNLFCFMMKFDNVYYVYVPHVVCKQCIESSIDN